MSFPSPTRRKWILVWVLIRLVSIPSLAFSVAFSIISPITGVVLILAVAVGSNVGLRILAQVSRVSLVSYIVYVLVALGLVGLWFTSIIDVIETLIIFIPITVGYWIISWHKA